MRQMSNYLLLTPAPVLILDPHCHRQLLVLKIIMVGDTDSESGSSSSSSEDKAQAAFSLVKYENPEVIDKEDPEDGDGDAESCEEILNSILPPREWEHSGKLWRQRVSASPATRLDVMNLQVITNTEILMVTVTIVTLQEQLDLKLQQRQARETGICQVRCEKMFYPFVNYTAAKI